MKITEKNVLLNQDLTSKADLFAAIAKRAQELRLVNSEQELLDGLFKREAQGTTGMEHGFAIPHAKIKTIKEPAVIVVTSRTQINDYKSLDNRAIDVAIALLIPAAKAQQVQMQWLSAIARKLNDGQFRKKLRLAQTKTQVCALFNEIEASQEIPLQLAKNAKMNIVGVTSCAAGVAHTYLARDKLVAAGTDQNINVRIETQGATGPENELTTAEIRNADLVIIASDISVSLDRFAGKKVFQSAIHPALKDASSYIAKAIAKAKILKPKASDAGFTSGDNKRFLSHIMNGVSWMIPLLVAAAIFIAIPSISGAIVNKSEIVTSGSWAKMVAANLDNAYWKFMYLMIKVGWTSISLMFPIFAAFTAFSIGNKPAFIPGLIGGFLAKPSFIFKSAYSDWFTPGYPFLDKTSGFWGALIIGIVIGYIMKQANLWIKLPAKISALKPMLILPFVGVVSVVVLMVLAINPAFGLLNEELMNLARKTGKSGKYILALIIAPMTASDLGGPVNKAAVTTMYNFYEARTFSLTMRVIPTITPSIGLGLAAIFDKYLTGRRVFDDDVRGAAPNAIILAMLGISEGGLPFVFKKPLLTVPINMLGGIVGAYVGIVTNTEQWFPDSAIWAWPFAEPVWGMLLGIAAGAIATTLMHVYFRALLMKFGTLKIDAAYNAKKMALAK